MASIQPARHVQCRFSAARKERVEVEVEVEVGRLYDDGFLYLKDDPRVWVESNHDSVSSVRSLELDITDYEGEEIEDSIGELSQLTHLSIWGGSYFKYLPNTLSTLYNLNHLKIFNCEELEEFPDILGNLKFLASLFLKGCKKLKYLPWSITKLSKLQFLYLPQLFRLVTLPPHLNDSIIISVEDAHIRKTWKELKAHTTETLSFQFPIIPEEEELVEKLALKPSTPGYLRLIGDLITPLIRDYFPLYSWIRILDLDLLKNGDQMIIPNSIYELPDLTLLYITNGRLPHHLPLTSKRLTHLSLFDCSCECDNDTVSHFESLGKLSTLTSLHLSPKQGVIPEDMDLPVSLKHLSLSNFDSIPDSFVESMAKLSNLNILTLSSCGDLKSLPLNLNLTKLILRNTTIKSPPIGIKHLEIIHVIGCYRDESCNRLKECWRNQLVNLDTLSYTCHGIKSLSSVTSLHNLRKLQLKDCFSLKELPQDIDKLEKLCTLDVSGTRIQSLPNSILNLHNLQRLILPKCFILKTLPFNYENKVAISVDDIDESYYKYQGYYYSVFETSYDEDSINSNSSEDVTKIVAESRQEAINEQASPHRHLSLPHDLTEKLIVPTSNDNPNAFISSPNHEIKILPTSNEAGTIPFVVDVSANTMQDHEVFGTDISKFPYCNNLPAVIMDNLVGWKDVEADGNCGFRCVAEVFHGGQENWPMARRAILNELKAHPDVYQKIYFDDYSSALQRIDWVGGSCGEEHYMEIVVDLFPVANYYQCPVMCFTMTGDGLNPQFSVTVFPWSTSPTTATRGELTIAHLGGIYKHYILLDLKDDFPVPPISTLWHAIKDETADWDNQYVTRRKSWDCLARRSRDSTHLDISDESHFTGGTNAVGENNQHALCSLQDQEIELLPCMVISKSSVYERATGSDFELPETISSLENNQEASHLERMDHIKLEMDQGIAPYSSINSVDTRSNYPTLENDQDEIARHGKVKNKPQKIEITRESVQLLLPHGLRLEDAAMRLKVSRSTFKRALKNYGITWPSSRKRKLLDSNKSAPHNAILSSGRRNSSLLNSADPSTTTGHDHLVENSDGPNQCSLPTGHDHVRIDNSQSGDFQRKSGTTQKKEIPLERIEVLMSQGLTIRLTAEHLHVSTSTLKRRLKEHGITWQSSRKQNPPDKNRNETHTTCKRNLSQQLNFVDHSDRGSHGQGVEDLAGPSQGPTLSYHLSSEHNAVNDSTPDVVTRTVGESPLSTQMCMDSHQRVEEHLNDGAAEHALVNTDLPPNERCSTFAVKAIFNEDIVRFNFSLSSSIAKLQEIVGKKLDLEVGTFKIKYLDDENEWVRMDDLSDLELAVSLSRSRSNVVRLSITLKT